VRGWPCEVDVPPPRGRDIKPNVSHGAAPSTSRTCGKGSTSVRFRERRRRDRFWLIGLSGRVAHRKRRTACQQRSDRWPEIEGDAERRGGIVKDSLPLSTSSRIILVVIVAVLLAGIVVPLVFSSSGTSHESGAATGSSPPTRMDQAKALIDRKTDIGDLVCTQDIDYFCQATRHPSIEWEAAHPNTAPCWKVIFEGSYPPLPAVLGPANYYCP
jgi:hypothetical protein